jgi:hypothetical protein
MVKNRYPCIFDEIKPYFGLHKIGTHWTRLRSQYYILFRVPTRGGLPVYEYSLDKFQGRILRDEYNEEIQRLFTFRELFGITRTVNRSLRIRSSVPTSGIINEWTDENLLNEPIILSYDEPNFSGHPEVSVLSERTYNKWFNSSYKISSIESSIKNFMHITDIDDLASIRMDIYLHIKSVIQRIDPESTGCADLLMDRFQRKICAVYSL